MRACYLTAAILIGACAATQSLQMVGPYASHLSASDLAQIRAVAQKQEPDGTLQKLEVVRPDRVRVEKGKKTLYTSFTVMRRHGHWIVDENAGGEAVATATLKTD